MNGVFSIAMLNYQRVYVPQIFHIFLDIFLDLFQAAEWLAGADALLIGSGVGGSPVHRCGAFRHGVAIVMGGTPK